MKGILLIPLLLIGGVINASPVVISSTTGTIHMPLRVVPPGQLYSVVNGSWEANSTTVTVPASDHDITTETLRNDDGGTYTRRVYGRWRR